MYAQGIAHDTTIVDTNSNTNIDINNSKDAERDNGFAEEITQLPTWFTSGYNEIHGLGVARVSRFDPSIGFKKALNKAVEDLNSNLMITLYAETFDDGYTTSIFDEFSIKKQENAESVIKIDSAIYQNHAFYLVTSSQSDSMSASNISAWQSDSAYINWKSTKFSEPFKANDYYLASGHHKYSKYAPYISWTKAKMKALNRLGRYIKTSLSKLDKRHNDNLQSLTYATTKLIFNNVFIISRKVDDNNCYLTIAVHADDVTGI